MDVNQTVKDLVKSTIARKIEWRPTEVFAKASSPNYNGEYEGIYDEFKGMPMYEATLDDGTVVLVEVKLDDDGLALAKLTFTKDGVEIPFNEGQYLPAEKSNLIASLPGLQIQERGLTNDEEREEFYGTLEELSGELGFDLGFER